MDHKNTNHGARDETERVGPSELLEDCWFFGNLLRTKSRMLRSFSDPCTSNLAQDQNSPLKSYEETYRSIEKLSVCDHKIDGQNLIRAPSVPSSLERQDRKSGPQMGKRSSRNKQSSRGLNRAPSLPISLEPEEFQDEEIEFSMGKLIRQASMNYSDTLPPRTRPTKDLTPSPGTTRQRSRRKPELDSIKIEVSEEITMPQRPTNQLRKQKSLIHLRSEESQGRKPLEKGDIKEDEGKSTRARRPYPSEAWGPRSYSAPPVPKWGGKRPTEDVKAQIKFWARAVASNVRQEC